MKEQLVSITIAKLNYKAKDIDCVRAGFDEKFRTDVSATAHIRTRLGLHT